MEVGSLVRAESAAFLLRTQVASASGELGCPMKPRPVEGSSVSATWESEEL